jgi:hypothetical protein
MAASKHLEFAARFFVLAEKLSALEAWHPLAVIPAA